MTKFYQDKREALVRISEKLTRLDENRETIEAFQRDFPAITQLKALPNSSREKVDVSLSDALRRLEEKETALLEAFEQVDNAEGPLVVIPEVANPASAAPDKLAIQSVINAIQEHRRSITEVNKDLARLDAIEGKLDSFVADFPDVELTYRIKEGSYDEATRTPEEIKSRIIANAREQLTTQKARLTETASPASSDTNRAVSSDANIRPALIELKLLGDFLDQHRSKHQEATQANPELDEKAELARAALAARLAAAKESSVPAPGPVSQQVLDRRAGSGKGAALGG